MPWWLYNIVFAVGYTLLLPHFFLRMWRRGGYRRNFRQRLGFYSPATARRLREKRRFWVHAVSVGEVFIALAFMRTLRARLPGASFVLSTTTSTGHAIATARLNAEDVLIYLPVDFPYAVRRAMACIDPLALVLVESELWPNLIREAARRTSPVMVINGRMSDSSYRGYRLVRGFFARVAAMVDCLCVQYAVDEERLLKLGVPEGRIRVAGTAKYDMAAVDTAPGRDVTPLLRAAGAADGDIKIVGGSTWPGEEAILTACCRRLLNEGRKVFLVLAPRHAERARAVAAELNRSGVRWALRSRLTGESPPAESRAHVLLVDTTGELTGFYAAADVVFVGKSLTRHGGQNVIEPAALGKATIVGPHMENFLGVVHDMTQARAIVQAADADALCAALQRFVDDGDLRAAYGRRAREMTLACRGALDRTADAFLEVCGGKTGGNRA